MRECFKSIPFVYLRSRRLKAGRFPNFCMGSPGFPQFLSAAAEGFAAPEWRVGYKHHCPFIWVTVTFALKIQLQFVVVTYSVCLSMCFVNLWETC